MIYLKRICMILMVIMAMISCFACKKKQNEIISVVIPMDLFGGSTSEKIMEGFKNENNTMLMSSGEEISVKEIFQDVTINEDGTLNYYFEKKGLEHYESASTLLDDWYMLPVRNRPL